MEQEKKRAQFAELPLENKKIIAKKCYIATLNANFRGSVLKDKYSFASSQFILDKAKYYVDNFATNSEKILYAKRKQEHEELTKSKGIYYRDDTKYQKHIEAINKIQNMEELDAYIKGNNPSGKEIPIHSLNLAISDRTRALGDKQGLYASVKEKLLKYGKYKYEKRQKQNKDKSKFTLEENKILSKITLMDFIDSEYICKQDYCKEVGLSVNTYDKRVSIIKEFDDDYYETYKKKLENKKNTYYDNLKPVVENILSNISHNKDYNMIDYYLAYKDLYTFQDLCDSCNKHHLDIRSLKTFFSKADVRSNLTIDSFLREKYTTSNGKEYSDEEKTKLYEYAKENSIPFNWHNVSLLVSRQNKQNTKNRS